MYQKILLFISFVLITFTLIYGNTRFNGKCTDYFDQQLITPKTLKDTVVFESVGAIILFFVLKDKRKPN